MSIGKRIQKTRRLRGITQKELGLEMGYPYFSADVRIAQYENGIRKPKQETIEKLAEILRVQPKALSGPRGYEPEDIIRFLFELETMGYSLDLRCKGDAIVLELHESNITKGLKEWKKIKYRLKNGLITNREYELWKACWPGID